MEGLNLDAAAKLPPLLSCVRKNKMAAWKEENKERRVGGEEECGRIKKKDLDAGEGWPNGENEGKTVSSKAYQVK